MSDVLSAVEVETGPAPTRAVIWLHGLGADGHDFEPVVPELGLAGGPPVRFVFPHAPKRPVTINMGLVMRAWYDIRGHELDRAADERGIRDSAAHVERLLAREAARGVAADRCVLAGFSQGGAIAAFAGLRHAHRLAGVLVLSAYLPLPESLDAEAAAANRRTPILQCHGTEDPMVPCALGESTAELLTRKGYAVEWRTYPMPHGVHPREIADIAAWLRAVLA